jgi:signal transduction histidine kinase
MQSFLHPDDKETVINHIKESMVKENGANSFEHRMIAKSGEIKWVLATVKVVKVDADGIPVEMIGFMKDITDRKLAQIQIAEANSTKDKLFSIIAHDLRNPLNAVIGFSELLVNNHESYEAYKIGEYSNCIHSSAINLNSLLENLLDWANAQRGMVAFNPKIIDLDSIINEEV